MANVTKDLNEKQDIRGSYSPYRSRIKCMTCRKLFTSPDRFRVRRCSYCKTVKTNKTYDKYA